MKLRQVILCGIVTALAVACCPCRHLTTSTQDSVRVETVVRTEYIPDTVFVKVPIESERQTQGYSGCPEKGRYKGKHDI